MTDEFDIDYDIDDLIEPENKKKNIFAKTHREVASGHGEDYQYDVLGQFYPEKEIGPDYQRKYKGREAHIEFMRPTQYFTKIGQNINDAHFNVDFEQTKKYKDAALKGDKFAMPWIDYKAGAYSGQEGRHRAYMANELGIEKMPVVVVDTNEEKYKDPQGWVEIRENEYSRKKKQNPFTYDEELI